MNLFYHGYHHSHSVGNSSAQIDARAAQRDASSAKTDVHYLEQEVDRLSLICEALWTVVKEKTGVTDEHLAKVIMDIDMADGKLDGKKGKTGPRVCGQCNRPNAKRHVRCMYCGEILKSGPFD